MNWQHHTGGSAPRSEEEQGAITAFLANPETHGGVPTVHLKTHLSHLFLAGSDAYKLKRARNLGFVNYSSPGRRHYFCLKEIEVNLAWAADLYHGVLPIHEKETGFQLGGENGLVVDWVVHMQRFADIDRLDHRLAAGLCENRELIRFSDDLYQIHQASRPSANNRNETRVTDLITQIASALCNSEIGSGSRGLVEEWQMHLEAAARPETITEAARRRNQQVRRCHGDLHLKNIIFWKGRLIGFDALEFDDDLRTIDILYDLAFPVMDLLHAGYGLQASLIMNRYLARNDDYTALALFRTYLSLRASIRALAAALSEDLEGMMGYLRTALILISPQRQPKLIALGGRSGSGKSTIARLIAPDLGNMPGAIILQTDLIRKLILKSAPESTLPPSAYTRDLSDAVYSRMQAAAGEVLRQGYTCILDATFLDPAQRSWIAPLACSCGASVHMLWLEAPADILLSRMRSRGPDPSDADEDVLKAQLTLPAPAEWLAISSEGDREKAAENVLTALRKPAMTVFLPASRNPAHDV